MSDAAVSSIATGAVTVAGLLIGFSTLWVKLRYGDNMAAANAKRVEAKIDDNTQITADAKTAAEKASEHSDTCDTDRGKILAGMLDHETRIASMEGRMATLQVTMDALTKNIDSTRHEVRGHMQTLSTKLDILGMQRPSGTVTGKEGS